MNARKTLFYSIVAVGLVVLVVVAPLILSDNAERAYLNAALDDLKEHRGTTTLDLKDPVVEEILKTGTEKFKADYVAYANGMALLVSVVGAFAVLTYRDSRRHDAMFFMAFFTIVALLDGIDLIVYAAILVLFSGVYAWISKRERKRMGG